MAPSSSSRCTSGAHAIQPNNDCWAVLTSWHLQNDYEAERERVRELSEEVTALEIQVAQQLEEVRASQSARYLGRMCGLAEPPSRTCMQSCRMQELRCLMQHSHQASAAPSSG